jgi:hypothetical protein
MLGVSEDEAHGQRRGRNSIVMKQRDKMRTLVLKYGLNDDVVCEKYAQAERQGEVERESNENNLSAEEYARALWRDGIRIGWLTK